METLDVSPVNFLEWAYGADARTAFVERVRTGQRAGQAFMNTLAVFDANGYNRLTGTLHDPFHQDGRLPMALDKLTSK
jgi:hypothetical protein